MTIDWTKFATWTAIAGRLLIGRASAALLMLNVRIAGISGIASG
jgi:hypothetical protein